MGHPGKNSESILMTTAFALLSLELHKSQISHRLHFDHLLSVQVRPIVTLKSLMILLLQDLYTPKKIN
jgi:hypothetical protein